MKKFVEELENIQNLIDNAEYKKASEKINQMKKEMTSKKDVNEYMDDLVGNLKQYFVVICSNLQKNVEFYKLDVRQSVADNNYSITQLIYFT